MQLKAAIILDQRSGTPGLVNIHRGAARCQDTENPARYVGDLVSKWLTAYHIHSDETASVDKLAILDERNECKMNCPATQTESKTWDDVPGMRCRQGDSVENSKEKRVVYSLMFCEKGS